MTIDEFSNSGIVAAYRERTPKSAARNREALGRLPSGIVHDTRYMRPYGIYGDRAMGSRKWDIDGNEYIDYYGGHGALLLGHSHPDVLAAVQEQAAKGMHLAASHELEVEWARLIQELIPSAERVRFTSSGTEATQLAIRLARAAAGRRKIIRFRNHFHGWHDHVAFGVSNHFDGSPSPGVLPEVANSVVLVDPNDVDAVAKLLERDKDIAAVMIEPLGAHSGYIPTSPPVLRRLREITLEHGVLLIFDEVVTAFRIAPGGAQALFGVTPDITTMAKIVAGGMPGGAVGGRKYILDWLDFQGAATAGNERISHQGTHNAHPVCAAAGVATLKIIKETDACERATALTARLRAGMNEILEQEGVSWAIYGEHSFFHIFTNSTNQPIDPTTFNPATVPPTWFKSDKREDMLSKLHIGMLVNGVDWKGWHGGVMSAAHSEDDIAQTLDAWRRTLHLLKEEGEISDPLASARGQRAAR